MSPARRGSGTGSPVSTDHMSATSATFVAIGPTVSNVVQSGIDAVDRYAPPARLQPDDAAARRGQPDRAAGIGAEAELAEPGRERRRVAARRAAGRAPRQAGVLHRAVPGVLARDAPRELVQVRLADDDRARGDESLDGRRGAVGHVIGVDVRAVGRADAGGVDQVLDEQRPPVQRPRHARPRLDVGDHRVPGVSHGRAPRPRSRRARRGSRAG